MVAQNRVLQTPHPAPRARKSAVVRPKAMAQKYEFFEDKAGSRRWRSIASNGEVISSGTLAQIAGADAIDTVRNGVPFAVVQHIAERLRLSLDQLLEYSGLSKSTVKARQTNMQPLSAMESDRLYRADRLITKADSIFLNEEDAAAWLRTPLRSLGNVVPLSLIDTVPGYEMVLDELGRIEYGAVA